MGMYIDDNKPGIIKEPKTIRFDLPEDVGSNLKHEIDSIIKHNGFLAEHTVKNKISQFLFQYKDGNNIHELRKQ